MTLLFFSEWTELTSDLAGVKMVWGWEELPIEIKTNSSDSSNSIQIKAYDSDENEIGVLEIFLETVATYTLTDCEDSPQTFSTTPPSIETRVWTIQKSEDYFTILVNSNQVVKIDLDGATNSACSTTWSGKKVAYLEIPSTDTATVYYRSPEGKLTI